MRYQLLGNSGLRVSDAALGIMTFGAKDWGTPEDEAARIYGLFRDAGGNFIDTANEIYAEGRAEEILGRLVVGHRQEIVIATKYSDALPGRDPNAAGNHRKSMIQSVERSLKRLGTDYVDVLWIHSWDYFTPVAEIMRGLDDLVRAGKVLYIGVSNAPAWEVSRANMLAELRGWTPFVGLQIEYNLIERTPERDLMPMARALDLAVVAWSPLASGILSGKYAEGGSQGGGRRLDSFMLRKLTERDHAIAEAVGSIAKEVGCSSPQLALAWLRSRLPNQVIPVLGARTLDQLRDNLGYLNVKLPVEAIERLDAVSAVPSGYPYNFLRKTVGPNYGGMFEMIDTHRDRGIWPAA
jgi:aryl-alcohol dehydrogenase-like predicted oxidoreductase